MKGTGNNWNPHHVNSESDRFDLYKTIIVFKNKQQNAFHSILRQYYDLCIEQSNYTIVYIGR